MNPTMPSEPLLANRLWMPNSPHSASVDLERNEGRKGGKRGEEKKEVNEEGEGKGRKERGRGGGWEGREVEAEERKVFHSWTSFLVKPAWCSLL